MMKRILFAALILIAPILALAEGNNLPFPQSNAPVIESNPTGFFEIKEVDGRWWFVDPNGRAFYAIGCEHVHYNGHFCEALGYAPYNRNAQAKYGSEAKWAEATLRRLKEWNFNSLACGNAGILRHHGLPNMDQFSLGISYADKDSLVPETWWVGFPNVFGDGWLEHCDQSAKEFCAPNRDDHAMIGYFIDNELEWYGHGGSLGLFGNAWKKPAADGAKKAWLAFIKEHVRDAAEFERIYGIRVNSLDDLLENSQACNPQNPDAIRISHEWVRFVAERYFKTTTEAIRKYDPNHLILGCRFASKAPDILDIAGKYCDVISFNMYVRIDVERGVPQKLVDELRAYHEKAQKPMMITEWSFPALDAGLPCITGGGMRVDTQAQRAQCFEHFQKTLFILPFMVASNYFMYVDEPKLGISQKFAEDTNYGLLTEQDVPYPELTSTVQRVNGQVLELHSSGELPPLPQEDKLAPWVTELPSEKLPSPESPMKLQTGPLSLEGPVDGHAWRMKRGDTLLGDLYPMIHQDSTGWLWVPTDEARILEVRRNHKTTVVDMEMSANGRGTCITRLTRDFTRPPSDKPLRPFNYRGVWRFTIPRDEGGWVAVQALWIENNDSEPWIVKEMYLFLMPAIGGDIAGDKTLFAPDIPNYFRLGGCWADEAFDTGAGCWFIENRDVRCSYWIDKIGRHRADLHYYIEENLMPGQKHEKPGPLGFFFSIPHASAAAYDQTVKDLRARILMP